MERNPDINNTGFVVTRRGTGSNGFRVTFANGWTVSVQFGAGNYCDHYDVQDYDKTLPKSKTAEIAIIHDDGTWYSFVDKRPDVGPDAGTHVEGWQTPEQVLAFMNVAAALPNFPASGEGEEHH
jgi:hypothetical protein